jgi:hypothetical protein
MSQMLLHHSILARIMKFLLVLFLPWIHFKIMLSLLQVHMVSKPRTVDSLPTNGLYHKP